MAACPVGELCESAAELAFQTGDFGAVADALEPFEHQRHIRAVLPDLFDWRLRERNRPPIASVRISAASGIVRTSPARSISRRFRTAAVNVRAPKNVSVSACASRAIYMIRCCRPSRY